MKQVMIGITALLYAGAAPTAFAAGTTGTAPTASHKTLASLLSDAFGSGKSSAEHTEKSGDNAEASTEADHDNDSGGKGSGESGDSSGGGEGHGEGSGSGGGEGGSSSGGEGGNSGGGDHD